MENCIMVSTNGNNCVPTTKINEIKYNKNDVRVFVFSKCYVIVNSKASVVVLELNFSPRSAAIRRKSSV